MSSTQIKEEQIERAPSIIKKNWKFVVSALVIIVVLTLGITISSDIKNTKTNYDGLIVTDKAGKSYMFEYSIAGRFNVIEFDVVNMRAKR